MNTVMVTPADHPAISRELAYMILFMALFTAMTRFGLGIGLVTLMIALVRT
ncbi:hypothetical protein D3C76_1347860 [compost metagenome]|uniref:hypothetical protein n=1 Tax=Pseudomonas umsongensis TaxID=198618 RepID=UPI000A80CEFD|nr:hypothetical protein [Pseudomonas umsongensis]